VFLAFFSIPINDYSLVIFAAESSPCAFAGNRGDGRERDSSGPDIGTLAIQRAVTAVLLQVLDHVASPGVALVLARGHEGEVNQLGPCT